MAYTTTENDKTQFKILTREFYRCLLIVLKCFVIHYSLLRDYLQFPMADSYLASNMLEFHWSQLIKTSTAGIWVRSSDAGSWVFTTTVMFHTSTKQTLIPSSFSMVVYLRSFSDSKYENSTIYRIKRFIFT